MLVTKLLGLLSLSVVGAAAVGVWYTVLFQPPGEPYEETESRRVEMSSVQSLQIKRRIQSWSQGR